MEKLLFDSLGPGESIYECARVCYYEIAMEAAKSETFVLGGCVVAEDEEVGMWGGE